MKLRSLNLVVLLMMVVTGGCGGSGGGVITPPTGPGPIVQPPVTQPPAPPTFTVTRILAFGDSLTEGESLGRLLVPTLHAPGTPGVETSYPYKLHQILASTYTSQTINVYNFGKGGEFAIGSAKDRLLSCIETYNPQVLLLLHGVNNVNALNTPGNTHTVGDVVDAVEEMVELARARNVDVFLANLPPQKPTAKATGGARIQQFNAFMPDVAAEEGAVFVDLYSNMTTDMLMEDGLHITPAGNAKIAELFYAKLKERYHRAPATVR